MRYRKIPTARWTEEDFAALSSDGKLLWFYVQTCPHSNMLGLFRLPRSYAAEDLNWSSERLAEPFRELLTNGFFEYDEATRLVFVRGFLEDSPLENPNQVKKAVDVLDELPQSILFTSLFENLKQYAKPFHEPLLKRLVERFPKPGTGTGTGEGTGLMPSSEAPAPDETRAPEELKPDELSENPKPEPPAPPEPAEPAPAGDEEPPVEYPAEVVELCDLFERLVKKWDPKFRRRSPKTWLPEMDRLLRIDKREVDEVRKVILATQANGFWRNKVLSPAKLREKYTTLWGETLGGKRGTTSRQHENSREPGEFGAGEVGGVESLGPVRG